MGYDFTRRRWCVKCGAKTKADRAMPREQVLCLACKYPNHKPTPDVPASEPDGETK